MTCLAARFCLIHCDISITDQFFRTAVIRKIAEDDAYAHACEYFTSGHMKGQPHFILNPVSQMVDLINSLGIVQEYGKLITAETRDGIHSSYAFLEALGYQDQELISDEVSQAVVYDLEAVNVEKENRKYIVGDTFFSFPVKFAGGP